MLDLFVVQIALIFFPGFLWELIVSNYSNSKFSRRTIAKQIMHAFMFGTSVYIFVGIIYYCKNIDFHITQILVKCNKNCEDIKLVDLADEIIVATILSFILSIIWLIFNHKRWMTRIFGSIDVYSSNNIWMFSELIHQLGKSNKIILRINDLPRKRLIEGDIIGFCDYENHNEFVLQNVTVTDDSGKKEELPHIYISRPSDNTCIDIIDIQ